MGSPMPWRDFERIFTHYGVLLERSKGKATHWKLKKLIDGKFHVYIVAVHKNQVDDIYVKKARRKFQLTQDDGVSDRDFFSH